MKEIQKGLVVHLFQAFIIFLGVPRVEHNIRHPFKMLAPQGSILLAQRLWTLPFINYVLYMTNTQHALLLLDDLHRIIIDLKTLH